MIVSDLLPAPSEFCRFHRSKQKFVPLFSGCYVLTTIDGTILYIGLATNLRSRIGQHLDSPGKTEPTAQGRAVKFYWMKFDNIQQLERTWLNAHIATEGKMPVLNAHFSPISI